MNKMDKGSVLMQLPSSGGKKTRNQKLYQVESAKQGGRETEGDKMGVEFAITDKMVRKHAFDEGVLKQREPQRM